MTTGDTQKARRLGRGEGAPLDRCPCSCVKSFEAGVQLWGGEALDGRWDGLPSTHLPERFPPALTSALCPDPRTSARL